MLSRDDVLRIYLQVSDELCNGTEWCWTGQGEPLQRFAALVEAHERAECAKVCDEIISDITHQNAEECWPWDAVADCAAAIRARAVVQPVVCPPGDDGGCDTVE